MTAATSGGGGAFAAASPVRLEPISALPALATCTGGGALSLLPEPDAFRSVGQLAASAGEDEAWKLAREIEERGEEGVGKAAADIAGDDRKQIGVWIGQRTKKMIPYFTVVGLPTYCR